jgi:uncharacterized membrane protein YraQ (UPF0718 family)
MDTLLWGAIVRIAQTIFDASPTIVVGWIVAAEFERILGREGTFKLFGGHTWRQLPYAWLLGMLLPVCSLGVIPIMVQMRKSGISGGTILAFGLTAPLFNPISVLYGLTLGDPLALFVFCICSLTIVTVLGTFWDWMFPRNWIESETLPQTPFGWKRIAAVSSSVCEQAFSRSSLYILAALVGVGLLSAFLPAGVLQKAAGKDDLLAPLTMAAVATFAYITPMVAIVQVASMFQHGNSIGAAFTLLVLGAGVNLGLIAWSVTNYKWKPTLVWIVGLLSIVLALAYCVDRPLRPKGVEPADHTHAFDCYCNPFQGEVENIADASWKLVKDSWQPEEIIASCAALVMLLVGGLQRCIDPSQRLMQYLLTQPEPRAGKGPRGDIVLPNSVIAASSLIGLVLASIGGCYLYYPPVSDIRQEMTSIQAELQGDCGLYAWDKIEYWIPIQEDWANKLKVSCYIRAKPLTRYQEMKLHVFMSKLELLEHAAEDKDRDEIDQWKSEAADSFRRLKDALQNT